MNATPVRLKKEVRALFWPWCAVVAAGALPVFLLNSYTKKMNLLSFFVGIPLLAALSLGNEFQQQTLTLWLTQPFSRRQLWWEKLKVLLGAVVTAALMSGMALFSFTWPDLQPTYKVGAIVCVLVTTAAAPLATLTARSTLGGFGLITAFLSLIGVVIAGIAKRRVGEESPVILPAAALTVITLVAIGYAGLMLWLAARKLARFQVTGGSADYDLLMSDSALVPRALAEKLRCRFTGGFLNLIRKELRILLPFWAFTLVALLYLGFAAIFRLLPAFPIPPRHPAPTVEFTVFMTLGSFFLLSPVFAGILSLGEERTSGTHAWHMTQPVSGTQQWLVKMVMAVLAGFASAVLLPLLVVIAVGSVLGSPFLYLDFRELPNWMLMVPVITFSAF